VIFGWHISIIQAKSLTNAQQFIGLTIINNHLLQSPLVY